MNHFTRRNCIAALLSGASTATLPAKMTSAQEGLDIPAEFQATLKKAGLLIDLGALDGFRPARILKNAHQNYGFAVRQADLGMEIRFIAATYDDPEPSPGAVTVRWGQLLFQGLLDAMHANMSVGGMAQSNPASGLQAFPEEDVRQEYGADFGVFGLLRTKPTFSRFPLGFMVGIGRKSPSSYGVVVFLFDGEQTSPAQEAAWQRAFYAMRYAP
ncbi:MAG: hypothetical protein AAFO77_07180 [Pseudomonadota bacterium]